MLQDSSFGDQIIKCHKSNLLREFITIEW